MPCGRSSSPHTWLSQWKSDALGQPCGLTIARGRAYVVSRTHAVIADLSGTIIETFGRFEMGHDIAVASDGTVYVADLAAKCVQKFVMPVRSP